MKFRTIYNTAAVLALIGVGGYLGTQIPFKNLSQFLSPPSSSYSHLSDISELREIDVPYSEVLRDNPKSRQGLEKRTYDVNLESNNPKDYGNGVVSFYLHLIGNDYVESPGPDMRCPVSGNYYVYGHGENELLEILHRVRNNQFNETVEDSSGKPKTRKIVFTVTGFDDLSTPYEFNLTELSAEQGINVYHFSLYRLPKNFDPEKDFRSLKDFVPNYDR
jgi:hypothetical protein